MPARNDYDQLIYRLAKLGAPFRTIDGATSRLVFLDVEKVCFTYDLSGKYISQVSWKPA
jgi:hypothetical protein